MTRPRVSLLAAPALVFALLGGAARADVVHLKNGNKITGQVIQETEEKVVLKVAGLGTTTVPRGQVDRIEREDPIETLISQARQRDKAGAFDEAIALYERVIAEGGAEQKKQAETELERLKARRERTKKHRQKPQGDVGDLGEELQGEALPEAQTLTGQLELFLRALETGQKTKAYRLIEPLVRDNPEIPTIRYLYGRLLEDSYKRRDAADEYRLALGPTFKRDRRATPWLGELARRALARPPERLARDSPGVGSEWRRAPTRRFAIYHTFENQREFLLSEPERALGEVLEKLELQPRDLDLAGKIQLFIYPTRQAYLDASGYELTAGHAKARRAPDGLLITISSYPDRNFYRATLRHEIAHAVLYSTQGWELPSWAHEGAATTVEPARNRAYYRQRAGGQLTADGRPPDLVSMMAGTLTADENLEAKRTWYGQAHVLFEALVVRLDGFDRALRLAKLVGRPEPDQAAEHVKTVLRKFRLTERELAATYRRIATTPAQLDGPPGTR